MAANVKAKGKQSISVHPVLEAGISMVKILVLITAGLVLLLSVAAGAEWYDIAIRTSLAILITGLLGWYLNWMLGKWIFRYEIEKLKNEQEQKINHEY